MKRKIMFFLVSVILLLGMAVPMISSAQIRTDNVILSKEIDENTKEYAKSILPMHLHALIEAKEIDGEIYEYGLGEGFSLFNVVSNTDSTCFPLIYKGSIVAILEVYKDNEFTSSLSKSFSDELMDVLATENVTEILFLTDGIRVQSFDGINSREIYEIYDNGEKSKNLVDDIYFDYKILNKVSFKDVKTNKLIGLNSRRVIGGPTSYKTLPVKGVSQSGKTCWAATCAAIINYYKGTSLNDVTVAKYIFGNTWNKGGTWTNMRDAYNHWGLYPSQKGVITYNEAIAEIKEGDPVHLGLDGHSVALVGYEDWRGSPDGHNEKIFILLEPNGGVLKSVLLKSNGNFDYSLGGGDNAWLKTRIFP